MPVALQFHSEGSSEEKGIYKFFLVKGNHEKVVEKNTETDIGMNVFVHL